ncbi:hypothetical protein CAPN006_12360 [Capnocytophaga canimorsus]|uniref:hypothetical protein n=1 Tax=Capnocytophaga canimorsus TaxID=28188 RepID=UPI001AC36239|nr:hypothetical protein [Capnocytophaga canimorsus]GIM56843.1 hypothetical protein CAPN006_12360 [Capnocytophaga canimorsus]
MKRIVILFLSLISCSQVKKEDKSQLINHITDSISKEIEIKVRAKIKDSIKKTEFKFENDTEEYLSKLAEVNFYQWKRDFLAKISSEPKQEGFSRKIEDSFSDLTITYIRKIKLKGKYSGKDTIINDFFNSVLGYCSEMKYLFKEDYELELEKRIVYSPPLPREEEDLNKYRYNCWCNSFDKADVIANDTIYSFDIWRGDCREVTKKSLK